MLLHRERERERERERHICRIQSTLNLPKFLSYNQLAVRKLEMKQVCCDNASEISLNINKFQTSAILFLQSHGNNREVDYKGETMPNMTLEGPIFG